jgi:hypothetical protein
MDNFNLSKQGYEQFFDRLLSQELCYESSAATENNIKRAMKRILGRSIKDGLLKGYSNLVLSEALDVHFSIRDAEGNSFDLVLYYGK